MMPNLVRVEVVSANHAIKLLIVYYMQIFELVGEVTHH